MTYAHRNAADEGAAQLVARSLSGSVIMEYGPTANGADVTVTTGTAFEVDAQAPSPAASPQPTNASSGSTTATAPTTTTTSATAGVTANGNFAPATSPVESLRPYDPRACPAGVTGNATGWGH